jgi:hypothetical protein
VNGRVPAILKIDITYMCARAYSTHSEGFVFYKAFTVTDLLSRTQWPRKFRPDRVTRNAVEKRGYNEILHLHLNPKLCGFDIRGANQEEDLLHVRLNPQYLLHEHCSQIKYQHRTL